VPLKGATLRCRTGPKLPFEGLPLGRVPYLFELKNKGARKTQRKKNWGGRSQQTEERVLVEGFATTEGMGE